MLIYTIKWVCQSFGHCVWFVSLFACVCINSCKMTACCIKHTTRCLSYYKIWHCRSIMSLSKNNIRCGAVTHSVKNRRQQKEQRDGDGLNKVWWRGWGGAVNIVRVRNPLPTMLFFCCLFVFIESLVFEFIPCVSFCTVINNA